MSCVIAICASVSSSVKSGSKKVYISLKKKFSKKNVKVTPAPPPVEPVQMRRFAKLTGGGSIDGVSELPAKVTKVVHERLRFRQQSFIDIKAYDAHVKHAEYFKSEEFQEAFVYAIWTGNYEEVKRLQKMIETQFDYYE